MVDADTPLSKIRCGIEQVHDMLGTAWGSSCLDHVARIERDGRVLMRIRNRLIDNHGQSYFNFEDAHGSTVPAAANSPIHRPAMSTTCLTRRSRWKTSGNWRKRTSGRSNVFPQIHCFPSTSVTYFVNWSKSPNRPPAMSRRSNATHALRKRGTTCEMSVRTLSERTNRWTRCGTPFNWSPPIRVRIITWQRS